MSNGLNSLLMTNLQNFLGIHAVETALLGHHNFQPALGISDYDLMRSENWGLADQGTILIPMPAGGGLGDPAIRGYWLPQRKFVDVPISSPPASFIFTPELTGCKIRVDRTSLDKYRVFHIQHESADYPQHLRGNSMITVDSSYLYPHYRCAALLHFNPGGRWSIMIQELTGVVGVSDGGLAYLPGAPAPNVHEVHSHPVP